MRKSFPIEVDCADCAAKCQDAIAKISGVESVTINFMTQKMKLEVADDADLEGILDAAERAATHIEPDFVIVR